MLLNCVLVAKKKKGKLVLTMVQANQESIFKAQWITIFRLRLHAR